MIRRPTFAILTVAALACGLTAVSYRALATGEDRDPGAKLVVQQGTPGAAGAAQPHVHHKEFDACAKACSDCQRACASCASHCTAMLADGKKEHVKTLQTCLDCADLCAVAAQIVSRNGPFADLSCKGCADACSRCATACAAQSADAHMKACADECRRCEKACRTMLEHVAAR